MRPRPSDCLTLARECKIHPAVAAILIRRGLRTSSDFFNFLNPSLSGLESPFVFQDMQKSVERIRSAISRKERILVYGDYDVDGITGSSILVPVLKKMGADAEVHIPHRVSEGYGLNLESLGRLLQKGFSLVITVDNGITGVEQVRYLTEHGADVIIVDHHTPKDEVPAAFSIICANVKDKKGDPHLAACGLAFKLSWALLESYQEVEPYLDLVALGTIADLAPVLGDNRILLKRGLELLSQARRPGIRALMEVSRISPRLVNYRDIAFGLAPRINAAGRMGSPLNAFKLLTTEDASEAKDLAKFLDGGNRDRQRVEAAAFKQAVEFTKNAPASETQERILVLEHHDWHEGVLGIIAARLVERTHKPAIVISMKNGVGKGSGRSIPGFSLFDAVRPFENLLENFGGHAQAIGLTIKSERLSDFKRMLNQGTVEVQTPGLIVELAIEDEILFEELNLEFLKDLNRLEPFGPGNVKPYFLSRGVRLKGESKKRGKDTLSCWMTDPKGKTTCEVVGFRCFERWEKEDQTGLFDVVHRPTLMESRGIAYIQLELEDWRRAT